MSELRAYALVRDSDQWLRSSFTQTALDRCAGIVELASHSSTAEPQSPEAAPSLGAGLAFDNQCRLYRSDPDSGRVQRLHWAALDPHAATDGQPQPFDLFARVTTDPVGDFTAGGSAAPLIAPRGLAVDVNDRLFVADSGADRILIYDLWSERLLRTVTFVGAQPVDLVAHGVTVYAVLAAAHRIVTLTARAGPVPFAMPAGCTAPARIAVAPGGTIAILERAGAADAHVWFVGQNAPKDFGVEFATDVEWEADNVLVVARRPEADFFRYQVGKEEPSTLGPLRARGYRGLGIVATPEILPPTECPRCEAGAPSRRIGFWTDHGFRNAVPARLRYERMGRVTTFRLDSGDYQTVWGRLFLDACVPPSTELRAHFITLDEPSEAETLERTAPTNMLDGVTIKAANLSPPMPPLSLVPAFTPEPSELFHPLHRRESGRELPWAQPLAGDPFETYEAPINAPPGRYLWVTLEFRGDTRRTPQVKCVRAEHPSHDYLRRLPRTFSRGEAVANFVRRYLAMFEGFLGETEARAVDRHALLNPRSAPDEVLPWLASFIGLVLDERWGTAPRPYGRVADARRAIIEAAAWLFRFRGTVPGLQRFIELYAGVPVVIIEQFRLRGIGGAIVGASGPVFSTSVLGGGLRVGGSVGEAGEAPLQGTVADAFRTHAHRFAVLIPALLDTEQLAVVERIIEVHRPAHTVFQVCTVGAGMRVGRGLHIELSSLIGPTGGFATIQLGAAALGRASLVGWPEEGFRLGLTRTGDPSLFR